MVLQDIHIRFINHQLQTAPCNRKRIKYDLKLDMLMSKKVLLFDTMWTSEAGWTRDVTVT